MPLDLRPEERTVNLYNKIQWVDNTESSLKKCEVGQNKNNIYSGLEEVTAFAILLESRKNLATGTDVHCKFTFMEEWETDEGDVFR